MRFRSIACSCLLIAGTAGSVQTLAASPDCARWIKEYQQGLAKRAVLGKKHVTHAAHHLARITPRPRPQLRKANLPLHSARPPKLSPEEMLKRFKVLCGDDLPDDVLPAAFTPASLDDAFIPPVENTDQPPLLDDGGGRPFGSTPGTTGTTTNPTNPTTNNPGGGLTGGYPITPIIPVTNNPTPVSPVPEPSSLFLLATGGAGLLPLLRRRRRARHANPTA